jgi:hypothetical protein
VHTLTETDVAALLDDLARLLPFPTTLYTDMGADSWAPQLYFGPVDPSSDLAAHRAGIDADTVRPVWWIDLDGGTRTILLDEVSPTTCGTSPPESSRSTPNTGNNSNTATRPRAIGWVASAA